MIYSFKTIEGEQVGLNINYIVNIYEPACDESLVKTAIKVADNAVGNLNYAGLKGTYYLEKPLGEVVEAINKLSMRRNMGY